MDIYLDAKVECKDESCGEVTYIIIDPTREEVTHLVVKESKLPNIERLVSIDKIDHTNGDEIYLDCTREDLAQMEPFIETDFIHSEKVEFSVPFDYPYALPYYVWPYVSLPNDFVVLNLEHIPPSELAVRRGADVEASDGHIGVVDEFVINPNNGHITHIVLREGYFWREKDVTIPVSAIDHIDENEVHLKIDQAAIESLPKVPLKRKWR